MLPLLLVACASEPPTSDAAGSQSKPAQPPKGTQPISPSPALADAAQRALEPGLPTAEEKARIFRGTGVLVKGQQSGGTLPPGPPVQPAAGGVVLNFEGADLREVIRNILGDILNESYTIDASVGGTVTIRTSSGIPRDALPATLEMLLRMNGAAMVKDSGIYKIVPQAAAVRGNITPQLGNSSAGAATGIFGADRSAALRRRAGDDAHSRAVRPSDATAVRPDELRNLLVLAGTERELKHLLDTIDMFDVDWMAGMSVGLFTLQNADVKAVGQELDKAIGDKAASPLTGILRIIPIERMNALLVITPQPAYLDEAKKWIARLDQGGGGEGPRFYVYNLQNQRAEKLGPLLTQAFTGRGAPAAPAPPPTVAPGTPAGTIVSPPQFQAQPAIVAADDPADRAPDAGPGRPRPARRPASASCATSRSSPTRTTTRCSSSPRPSSTR